MEAWVVNLEPNFMNREDGSNLPPEYLFLIVKEKQRNVHLNNTISISIELNPI